MLFLLVTSWIFTIKRKRIKLLLISLYNQKNMYKYDMAVTIVLEFKLRTYYKVKRSQSEHILTVGILHNQYQIFPSYHSHIHTTWIIAIGAKLIKISIISLYNLVCLYKEYLVTTIIFDFKLRTDYQVKRSQSEHILTVGILHNPHQICSYLLP
jgi:hypothetical protein